MRALPQIMIIFGIILTLVILDTDKHGNKPDYHHIIGKLLFTIGIIVLGVALHVILGKPPKKDA